MRSILLLLLALAALWSGPGHAQGDYPSKPIQLLVGFPPGGGNDIMARLLGAKLQEAWRQPVVVVNKPGATSIIAADFVAKAPPDGYTLLVNASLMTIIPVVHSSLPYDTLRDFEPVTMLADFPFVLAVHPSLKVHSVKELVGVAKSQPGKLNYGAASTAFQLTAELFKQQAGIDVNHIPYKGSAQSIKGLLANEVQLAFIDTPPMVSQINSGRLRGLAVTSRVRSSSLPELPTMIEAGVADFEIVGWFALFAPAGTPKPIVNKLYTESAKIVRMPDLREKLVNLGAAPVGNTPEELREIMKKQMNKWITVAKSANIKAN